MSRKPNKATRARRAAKPAVLNLDAKDVTDKAKPTDPKAGKPAAEPARAAKAADGGGKGPSDKPSVSGRAGGDKAKSTATAGQGVNRRPWKLYAGAAVAVLLAGIVAGAWFYRDVAMAYLPSPVIGQVSALEGRIATLEQQLKQQDERTAKLTADLARQAARADQLAAAIAAASEKTTALGKAIADLPAGAETGEVDKRITDLGKRVNLLTTRLEDVAAKAATSSPAAAGGGDTTGTSADTARLAAIDTRINRLDGEIKTLAKAHADLAGEVSAGRDRLAARTNELAARIDKLAARVREVGEKSAAVAAAPALGRLYAALADGLRRGRSFAAQLSELEALKPQLAGLDRLRRFADTGVATRGQLADDLDKLIAARAKPADKPENAAGSTVDQAWNLIKDRLGKVVKVRRVDDPDWGARLATARAALAAGDLGAAVGAVSATGEAPADIAAWRARASATLAAEQALKQVSDAVIAELANEDQRQ